MSIVGDLVALLGHLELDPWRHDADGAVHAKNRLGRGVGDRAALGRSIAAMESGTDHHANARLQRRIGDAAADMDRPQRVEPEELLLLRLDERHDLMRGGDQQLGLVGEDRLAHGCFQRKADRAAEPQRRDHEAVAVIGGEPRLAHHAIPTGRACPDRIGDQPLARSTEAQCDDLRPARRPGGQNESARSVVVRGRHR
jgi:hypothetical protein